MITVDRVPSEIRGVAGQFCFGGQIASISPIGNGHINDTYLIVAGEDGRRFVLQRINHNIFTSPYNLISNIEMVVEHLRRKIEQYGGDVSRETLTFVPTNSEDNVYKYMHIAPSGHYYRAYKYIADTVTYDSVEDPWVFYQSGRAFGRFQYLLSDFDARQLYEVIPDFHNTLKRYRDLCRAAEEDAAGRAADVKDLLEFVSQRINYMTALDEIGLPLRVTHNDTKLNNVMFDKQTGEGICVIDLDTVMPGLSLYDFGDSIRFGASSALEDEVDLSKVYMCLELFEQYTKGFLQEAGSILTPTEIDSLPLGAIVITFECGIRFLTDHLNGDVYFKTDRPGQNLDRCKTQFKLVSDMESKMADMKAIVDKYK